MSTSATRILAHLSYPKLLDRKQEVEKRLSVVSVRPPPSKRRKTSSANAVVPVREKTDTHFDYLLKEMQWLSADFTAERKRHLSSRKKLANAIKQHHQSREARIVREFADAELKRRRLAAKIGREVKGWWTKIERVISYKQKLSADEERRKAMNKQLVTLVKQTELYSESLARQFDGDEDSEDDGRRKLTIEEALASGLEMRQSKKKVKDYSTVQVDPDESSFYGETTASDSGSDGSYAPEKDSDDESTMRQAEKEESLERRREQGLPDEAGGSDVEFQADPVELSKLQEEAVMDINDVLQRLREGGVTAPDDEEDVEPRTKRVKFASTDEISSAPPRPEASPTPESWSSDDPGEEADDDADASDVEDFQLDEQGSDGDSFVANEAELVDDETTMEQEETLPRDITTDEEILLLEAENELSVEELRRRYSHVLAAAPDELDQHSDNSDPMEIERTELNLTEALLNPDHEDGDGDEFVPVADEMVDDETTIAAEERLGRDMSYQEELAILKRESEMSVEELRAMYAGMDASEPSEGGSDASSSRERSKTSYFDELIEDQENDEEFRPEDDELVDDETTIEAEERLGREMSLEAELEMLRQESEVPVESLVEKYTSVLRPRDEEEEGSDDQTGASDLGKGSETETSDVGRDALVVLERSAERARTTVATRPFILAPWVKLREYQQVGLNWLVNLQTRRLNGILADEMGLGKTLQTIALLAYLAAYNGIWGPHLIIVPTSVILNWETELKRFCPSLKVLCYYGAAKRRKELRTGWTKANWYHVVVTSYQLAVQDSFAFKRKKWYYLVLDEAQNIKNFQSQRWQTLVTFNSQRRLLLTGTPLQNNLLELWSLLHFLMPYIFRSRKQFAYWFENPMNNIIEGSGTRNDDVVTRLHGIIRPFVLRRLKKDVETQMPGKFEHVIKCQLSRRQMLIYEEFLARSSTRQAMKRGGNFMGMMNVLMQLRKVCNHPDLFEPRAVVTPFVGEQLCFRAPSCSMGIMENTDVLDCLSVRALCPVWCGSTGEPSMESALRQDHVEAAQLSQWARVWDLPSHAEKNAAASSPNLPNTLLSLLKGLEVDYQLDRKEHLAFLKNLNSSRCDAPPFLFSQRLIDAVSVDPNTDPILTTPAALLEMRRSQERRAEDLEDLIKKFIFCVPKADARRPFLDVGSLASAGLPPHNSDEMIEPIETLLRPYRLAEARLSSFFPDKRLIQFDAGKLQTLAELLRELSRGGHRVLIFTQMSKMLDILEAFLNLNGYTYLRLDGSTGVDRRQRLMDRFNNDAKVFCFILSTRSGGLGINLTGADTVVFYDQDWNPAMDAQAQDRAHRIGQTREVHIYRLVTEHTIEENILRKAQQKRNLDIIVMDKGRFNASQLFEHGDSARAQSASNDGAGELLSQGGLREILGVGGDETAAEQVDQEVPITSEKMERAMTSLEDVDDVQALRGAQKEVADELKEFDESVEIKKGSDSDDGEDDEKDQAKTEESAPRTGDQQEDEKTKEAELEKEFAAWHDKVGLDANAISASLAPAERYGMKFREEIDPFYSIFAVMEYRRKLEAEAAVEGEVDIEEIEREKAYVERRAIDDGDLLATHPKPKDLIRQRNLYQRERARLRAVKKRQTMTGAMWETRMDALTKHPFWYNIHTGEARWDKPALLMELEALELAHQKLFAAMPIQPLVHLMGFLRPWPDRMSCALVSRHWKFAATDPSFVRHVYPVEMGAYSRGESKMEPNHYRTIADSLASALPGDTIELGDGHYWTNEDIEVSFPVRLVGDENNPANVVIEMSGTLRWGARGGWCEGITFRRPKLVSRELTDNTLIRVDGGSKLDIVHTILDNDGSTGPAVDIVGPTVRASWTNVAVRGGLGGGISLRGAAVSLDQCRVTRTGVYGIHCVDSDLKISDSSVGFIDGAAFEVKGASRVTISKCHVANPVGRILVKDEQSVISSTNNTASKHIYSATPGFRPIEDRKANIY